MAELGNSLDITGARLGNKYRNYLKYVINEQPQFAKKNLTSTLDLLLGRKDMSKDSASNAFKFFIKCKKVQHVI